MIAPESPPRRSRRQRGQAPLCLFLRPRSTGSGFATNRAGANGARVEGRHRGEFLATARTAPSACPHRGLFDGDRRFAPGSTDKNAELAKALRRFDANDVDEQLDAPYSVVARHSHRHLETAYRGPAVMSRSFIRLVVTRFDDDSHQRPINRALGPSGICRADGQPVIRGSYIPCLAGRSVCVRPDALSRKTRALTISCGACRAART